MQTVSLLIANPWRAPVMIGIILVVIIVEIRAMSRREFEVMTAPIRRFLSWIHPVQ
jgi:hypothetical protein